MKISIAIPFAVGLSLVAARSFAAEDAAPPASASNSDDEVVLTDGSALRGRITDQRAGSFVVIMANDGRVHTVQWAQIARVSASSRMAPAAALRTSLPAAPDAPPAPEAPPALPEYHAEPTPVRFELGARLGYSFGAGDYANGAPIGNAISQIASDGSGAVFMPGATGGVPIVLDLGARIGTRVYVGGFFQYAFLGTSCMQLTGVSANCDAHNLRAGVDVQIHLLPHRNVDPWFGFAFGHEWLTTNATISDSSTTVTDSHTLDGWNLADVMFGLDLRMSGGFAIGPYAELSSGSFTSGSQTLSAAGGSRSGSSDITATSAHQWITIGLRGTFEFGGGDDAR